MAVRQTDLLQGTLDLLVLKSLSSGPNHGYGIATRIHQFSDEALRIQEGSLYPALHRMEQRGWIEPNGRHRNNRRAKFYRLTRKGRSQPRPSSRAGCDCRKRSRACSAQSSRERDMKLRAPRLVRRLVALFRWRDRDRGDGAGDGVSSRVHHRRRTVRSGMSQTEAAHAARRQFGNGLRLKEAGHDVRTAHLDRRGQDLEIRGSSASSPELPAFACVAVLTLALGIGANTAIFAVVKSALLDALPYDDADRLVRVSGGLVTATDTAAGR